MNSRGCTLHVYYALSMDSEPSCSTKSLFSWTVRHKTLAADINCLFTLYLGLLHSNLPLDMFSSCTSYYIVFFTESFLSCTLCKTMNAFRIHRQLSHLLWELVWCKIYTRYESMSAVHYFMYRPKCKTISFLFNRNFIESVFLFGIRSSLFELP